MRITNAGRSVVLLFRIAKALRQMFRIAMLSIRLTWLRELRSRLP